MNKSIRTALLVAGVVALSSCGVFKGGGGKKTPTLGQRVPILASENAIEPDRTIRDVQVLLPPAETNDSWTQPGGDAAKAMGQLTLAANPSKLWSASVNGGSKRERLGAAPVVADGKLFVMDVESRVTAFNANTGQRLWTQLTTEDRENRNAHFGGGVSFDDGKLFATNGIGEVAALDAASGKVLWRVKPGGPLRGAPTVAYGTVYVLSQDNQLFALSQADGKVVWTQSGSLESQGVFGVAAPSAARGTLVVGFSSGELNAYRYENGRTLWSDTLTRSTVSTSVSSLADVDASPVIDENRVYALGEGGRMVALELTTGRRIWEINLAGTDMPWLAGEWLFVVTDDGNLVCLSRGNGKVRWLHVLGNFTNMKKSKGRNVNWTAPVLAGGHVIVGSSEGELRYLSPADGKEVRRVKGLGSILLPPIVANNTLYVIDQRGKITAFR